tara:strand:- start:213 stop:440 length:228 start_codon:yes stop_codon:yes gene_type:complete
MSELRKLKRFSRDSNKNYRRVRFGHVVFREYTIGQLPKSFGVEEFVGGFGKLKKGCMEWFKDNKRGFIYIEDNSN